MTRQDTYRALSEAVLGSDKPKIWDRLWVSEYVYCGINPGRPCEFNTFETGFIRRLIDAMGLPMIVCLPPFDVVQGNAGGYHQMEGVNENMGIIYDAYHTGELPWPRNTMYYDYTGQFQSFATLPAVEEEVAGYLEERHLREAWLTNPIH